MRRITANRGASGISLARGYSEPPLAFAAEFEAVAGGVYAAHAAAARRARDTELAVRLAVTERVAAAVERVRNAYLVHGSARAHREVPAPIAETVLRPRR